jgi:hypothetical protein
VVAFSLAWAPVSINTAEQFGGPKPFRAPAQRLVDAELVQQARVKFMWFPDWIYERLPFLYLAFGGICPWLFGISPPVLLSVALFVCASLLTLSWRRAARRAGALRVRRRRPTPGS